MHDLSALESNESYENMEWEEESDEAELDESEELESAAELLAVGNEAELDQFLGKLIRKAARKVGRSVKAATGNSLGGLLKSVARTALPMVASAVGGPVGGLAAKGGLDVAMKAFGLELEGLSEEDQELEVARKYVRFANAASRRAVRHPSPSNPRAHTRQALRWAMRRHAPGLLHRLKRWNGSPWGGPRSHAAGYGGPGRSYGGYAPPAALDAYLPPAPVQCPACAPCPTCPDCGAPTPSAPPDPPAADTAPGELEYEYQNEHEQEHEHECEGEGECEHEQEGTPAGRGGRWVRRGSRIILYGA